MFRINLLPEECRSRMQGGLRVRLGVVMGLGALGIVLVSVVGTTSWQSRLLDQLNSRQAELQSEADRYRPQINLVNQLRMKKADLEQRLGSIHRLDQDRSLRVEVVEELARAVPEFVWLTSFLEEKDKVTVEGVAFSTLAVFEFMVALESMPNFAEVRLTTLRQGDVAAEEVSRFTLTTTLLGG